MPNLRIVPANEASFEDLQAVFGERGSAANCQCQRYKLAPREAFAKFPVEERQHRLRTQTCCEDPDARDTSGLVAYAGDEPVGWVAVEPRPKYSGLLRNQRVPWVGRQTPAHDPSIWAVTCVFVRVGHRRAGLAKALAVAAVEFARSRGATAIEAYPIVSGATWDEIHVGTPEMFTAAGLSIVHRPTKRRLVMRKDF